jgi:protein O-GlcNAc transferase
VKNPICDFQALLFHDDAWEMRGCGNFTGTLILFSEPWGQPPAGIIFAENYSGRCWKWAADPRTFKGPAATKPPARYFLKQADRITGLATGNNSIERFDPDTSVDGAGVISHAWRMRAHGDLNAAAQSCERALRHFPEMDEGWHLLGLVRWDLGNREPGIACLKHAIELNPVQPQHYNTLGVMLIETGDYISAEACLDKALEMAPGFHDARSNLGLALFHRKKLTQARRCFLEVLKNIPGHCEALANLGMVHLACGDIRQAARAYEKALGAKPGRPRWQGNLGAAYLSMARFEDAARCFQDALSASPDNPAYCVGLGIARRATGDWTGSIEVLEHALKVSSGYGPALANLAVAYQQICQWSKLDTLYRRLDDLLQTSLANGLLPDEQPLMHIRRCAAPADNLAVARAWSRVAEHRALKAARPMTHQRPSLSRGRITVGYLSYDFRDHPVSHQLLPLFGLHDRRRFRVKAFSMGPDDGSSFRQVIQSNCDHFIDISEVGLHQAVGQIADHQVDILIDLMGHTHHNRMEILALRPAPLQVGYLGFLSSSGAGFIDYVLADKVVIPEEHTRFYSEKIIRMPHCYQMNHRRLIKDRPPAQRKRWGLPENAMVYCCFNQAYKFGPDLYASWMRILERVPRAVLWLSCDQPSTVGRLRQLAERCRIDPQRLIFAEKLPLEQHLCRLQSADLALDTITYNGGATTANCLCAGVPVLTVLGTHWVSRMSASHLFSADLPELVTGDLAAYEEKAIHLAQQPEELRALRRRLRQAHTISPLFRPEVFVKDMEAAYERIWQSYLSGQAPSELWLKPGGARPAGFQACNESAPPLRMRVQQ